MGLCLIVEDNGFRYEEDESYYNSINKGGWGTSTRGYAVYSVFIEGFKIIFTGMKIKKKSTVRGKGVGVPYLFETPQQVENYVNALLQVRNSFKDASSQNLQDFTHELRGVINSISDKADEVEHSEKLQEKSKGLLRNIRALAGILGAKADIANFLSSGKLTTLTEGRVGVYRKFDKIIKCLENPKIRLSGKSERIICDVVVGFEIIPYLLLTNAEKYTPSNYDIEVEFEDLKDEVRVRIKNVGPKMDEEELGGRIFEKGYRGRNAKKKSTIGHGLGLYIVKDFLERAYYGRISIEQNSVERLNLNGIPYVDTTFTVLVPCKL